MMTASTIAEPLDIETIRRQFPVLEREVKGHRLVYLDNAATSQKPQAVIDAIVHYYSHYNANIHRGIHTLAEEATAAFEQTRDAVHSFINSNSREEIIFTRGTTEGINLVANTWGRQNIKPGDEIIISEMEHHSNIVPWQILCESTGGILRVVPVTESGELSMEAYYRLLSPKTKLVSIVHVSNVLGTVNPVKQIIDAAHDAGALALIDGAQSAVHLDIDVQAMDADFFVFSAHKLYGPTGVGVLYGKKKWLQSMPVFMGGGEMIREVSLTKTTYNDLPYKYEAGTPNIADTIAFGTALQFIRQTGKQRIRLHEQELLHYATARLGQIPGLHIIGQAAEKASVISFSIDKVHPQDAGILLDNRGIAVRTGHHCAQPLMHCLGIPGTIRASFAVYNQLSEIDELINGLQKVVKLLA